MYHAKNLSKLESGPSNKCCFCDGGVSYQAYIPCYMAMCLYVRKYYIIYKYIFKHYVPTFDKDILRLCTLILHINLFISLCTSSMNMMLSI